MADTYTYSDLAKAATQMEQCSDILDDAYGSIKVAEISLGRLEVLLPVVIGHGVAIGDGILALDSLGRFAQQLREQLHDRLDELYRRMEAMPESKQ